MKCWQRLRAWLGTRTQAQPNPLADDEPPLAPDEDPFAAAPVVWEITDTIDLHSVPPRQIKAVVIEYLQLAHEHGFPVVRIIHGKGKGVQRETVRQLLGQTPFVIEFHDAPDASGWGATIAQLDSPRS